MFNRAREFNIISGENVKYASQRSYSNAEQRRLFQNEPKVTFKTTKLGSAKDRKEFNYNYIEEAPVGKQRIMTEDLGGNSLPSTLLNYVSTNYNIITHKQQQPTSKIVSSAAFNHKMPQVNKKSPLTAIIHAGRLVAPNYHADYHERQVRGEFIRKRGGLCQFVCDVEKGYGLGKYFRKMK